MAALGSSSYWSAVFWDDTVGYKVLKTRKQPSERRVESHHWPGQTRCLESCYSSLLAPSTQLTSCVQWEEEEVGLEPCRGRTVWRRALELYTRVSTRMAERRKYWIRAWTCDQNNTLISCWSSSLAAASLTFPFSCRPSVCLIYPSFLPVSSSKLRILAPHTAPPLQSTNFLFIPLHICPPHQSVLWWEEWSWPCIILPVQSPNMTQISILCSDTFPRSPTGHWFRIVAQQLNISHPYEIRLTAAAAQRRPCWGSAAPQRPVWSVIGKCAELISSLSTF